MGGEHQTSSAFKLYRWHGKTGQSLTVTICSNQEEYKHSLDMSSANRLFKTCDSRCVYNIDVDDADNFKALLWNDHTNAGD